MDLLTGFLLTAQVMLLAVFYVGVIYASIKILKYHQGFKPYFKPKALRRMCFSHRKNYSKKTPILIVKKADCLLCAFEAKNPTGVA